MYNKYSVFYGVMAWVLDSRKGHSGFESHLVFKLVLFELIGFIFDFDLEPVKVLLHLGTLVVKYFFIMVIGSSTDRASDS